MGKDAAQNAADKIEQVGQEAGKIPVYGWYAQLATTAISTGIRAVDALTPSETDEQRKARLAANEKFQRMANDSPPPAGALPRKAKAMGDDDETTGDDEMTLESEGGVFVARSGKAQGDKYKPAADESDDDESDASEKSDDETDVTDDAPAAKAKAKAAPKADGPDVTKDAPRADDEPQTSRPAASRSDLMRHLKDAAASLAKAIEAAEGVQVAPRVSNGPQNAAQSVSGPAPMTGTGESIAAAVNPFVRLIGAAIDRQGR